VKASLFHKVPQNVHLISIMTEGVGSCYCSYSNFHVISCHWWHACLTFTPHAIMMTNHKQAMKEHLNKQWMVNASSYAHMYQSITKCTNCKKSFAGTITNEKIVYLSNNITIYELQW